MMLSAQLSRNVSVSGSASKGLRSKQRLGQHFTPPSICKLMVKNIPALDPRLVVDLAVGQGELLWHAKQEWLTSHIMGFDIDEKLIQHCKSRFGQDGTFECVDILRTDLRDIHGIVTSHSPLYTADLVLSNPPFGTIEAENLELGLLDTLSAHHLVWIDSTGGKRVRTEVAFFIRNLEVVCEGGYVVILLPESAVSGVKAESFRHFLLANTRLRLILSLPPNSFNSSEARISLLIVQKSACNTQTVAPTQLGVVNTNVESAQTMTVNQHELLPRMDPKYYYTVAGLKNIANGWRPLGEYLDCCTRGYGFYGAERELLTRESELTYIHSTDIADFVVRKSRQHLAVPRTLGKRYPQALISEGDVLLVRVGRGCVSRCAIANKMLSGGFASDCIYVIRSQRVDPYYLCLFLNTSFVKDYLDACRRGVCSQYITKADLMALPFFLPEEEVIRRLSRDFRTLLDQVSLTDDLQPQLSSLSLIASQLNVLISKKLNKNEDCRNNCLMGGRYGET